MHTTDKQDLRVKIILFTICVDSKAYQNCCFLARHQLASLDLLVFFSKIFVTFHFLLEFSSYLNNPTSVYNFSFFFFPSSIFNLSVDFLTVFFLPVWVKVFGKSDLGPGFLLRRHLSSQEGKGGETLGQGQQRKRLEENS